MARKQAKPAQNGDGVAVADSGTEVVWKGNELLRPFLVPIRNLREDDRNANTHPDRSIEAIASSYLRFGQAKPIICAKDGTVKDGNGQLVAAAGLGWTHIAVIPSDLEGNELLAYSLAANRTAQLAEWDYEQLVADLKALQADGQDIDDLGWSDYELSPMLAAEWSPPPITDEHHGPETITAGVGVSVGGSGDGVTVSVVFTKEQYAVFHAACSRVRDEYGLASNDGRCVELISKVYLDGR